MDADDIVMPNRLGLQLKFMQEHPEVVVLGGSYLLIDDQGRELTVRTPPIDDDALQRQLLAGQNPICHSLVMMRRDAVQKAGGYLYDLPAAEDLDLWLRLGEIGRIACLPEVLLKYRLHSGTISESKQELQLQNMRQACERAWKRRGIHGEFQGQLWRPLDTRQSRHEFALRYGWWAFNGGHGRDRIRLWAQSGGVETVRAKWVEVDGMRRDQARPRTTAIRVNGNECDSCRCNEHRAERYAVGNTTGRNQAHKKHCAGCRGRGGTSAGITNAADSILVGAA